MGLILCAWKPGFMKSGHNLSPRRLFWKGFWPFYCQWAPIVRSNYVKDLRKSSHIIICKIFGSLLNHCFQCLQNSRADKKDLLNTFYHSQKILLYLTQVHSRLTYCSQLWRPYLLKDISTLERVQRRVTKYNYPPNKIRLIQLDLV